MLIMPAAHAKTDRTLSLPRCRLSHLQTGQSIAGTAGKERETKEVQGRAATKGESPKKHGPFGRVFFAHIFFN